MRTISSKTTLLPFSRWCILSYCSGLFLMSNTTNASGAMLLESEDVQRKFLRHVPTSSSNEALNIIENAARHRRRLSEESRTNANQTKSQYDDDYNSEAHHSSHYVSEMTGRTSLMASTDIYRSHQVQDSVVDFDSDMDIEHRLIALEQRLLEFAGTIKSMRSATSIEQENSYDEKTNEQQNLTNPYEEMFSLIPSVELSSFGSNSLSLSSFQDDTSGDIERSPSDLDRGRYLVGLEVREVQSHQQIILDYSSYGHGPSREPIRVRYMLSAGAVDLSPSQFLVLSKLLETSFPAAANAWFQALKVTPVPHEIFPTVRTCGAATVPASDRENGVDGADLVIYVSSDSRFCGGALMHSAVCDFDQYMRPIVGNINICTNNFPENTFSDEAITVETPTLKEYAAYLTTETGRILGASTSLFRYYLNPRTLAHYGTSKKSLTCLDGTKETLQVPNIIFEDIDKNGQRSYEIRTPKVVEMVRNHFDCMILTGAKLEQRQDSIGCLGSFLDDHLFYSEEMTGFEATSTAGPSISPLTLALLEDSSWYVANYEVSVETSFGRGAGCQFARSGCHVDETSTKFANPFSGFHCSKIGEMGCDASHSYKAKCDFVDSLSSTSSDSYCPMYTREAISCTDSSGPLAIQGEYFGESSKCFHTDKGEPMCLRGECNASTRSIDIYYGDEIFQCHMDDQIIDTKKGLKIKCPRISAVCPILSCPSNCSGKGICDIDIDGKHSCICDDPYDESPGCWGESSQKLDL
ncbi:hypothetical protein HJC23_003605 [Cyclotella cryptica]|uniref:EGF-like domain-containing protein n=1 Tax=Cyclotella cryptica TaxID=29204 RepID=A0ABD3QK39_9STRA|eukprot:CCRYP_004891-RA/>CCRYP_004891-RA protein AED:0.12 eAED:0.12 QI:158/1/1/1/1/1/5/34/750